MNDVGKFYGLVYFRLLLLDLALEFKLLLAVGVSGIMIFLWILYGFFADCVGDVDHCAMSSREIAVSFIASVHYVIPSMLNAMASSLAHRSDHAVAV